jgi:DTW domain-containing protein YfiP
MSFNTYIIRLKEKNPDLQSSNKLTMTVLEFDKQLMKAYNQGWEDAKSINNANTFVKSDFSDIFGGMFK